MRVIRINKIDEFRNVSTIVREVLREGGLIIYPTDTVYGLGCDPLSERAVIKIFKLKKRKLEKPLPVLISNLEIGKRIAYFNKLAEELAKEFWPGPLTLILKKKRIIPDIVTGNKDTIGIRMPNHEIALAIININNGMLIGTSANLSGRKPPITAEEAVSQLGNVDLVIDSGKAPLGIPSTCIDLTTVPPRLVREGAITKSLIERVLGEKLL